MIDFNGSWDINDNNKTPNRLSQLFIFGSGLSKVFARTASFCSVHHPRPVQTETQFNPTFQIMAIAVGDKLRTVLSLQMHLNRPKDDYIRNMELNWVSTRAAHPYANTYSSPKLEPRYIGFNFTTLGLGVCVGVGSRVGFRKKKNL